MRHLSRTHTLLLNKFNVVAHHLICVTREFEQQTEPLNAADLEATWAAMQVIHMTQPRLCASFPITFTGSALCARKQERVLSGLPKGRLRQACDADEPLAKLPPKGAQLAFPHCMRLCCR